MRTDIIIAGSGCSGLYAAFHLPRDKKILLLTKRDLETNDSFLAQGGMCVLKSEDDYASYFEDTMKAGHYENDPRSVDIMIRSSQDVLQDLISVGVRFAQNSDGTLDYTREGGHSQERIVYHEDITGKEITSHLLAAVKQLENVTMVEYAKVIDIVAQDNVCYGAVIRKSEKTKITCGNRELTWEEAGFDEHMLQVIGADVTILATGGVGGLYRHSTNYRHLTGDGVAIAMKHGVALRDIHYVQIHPTTFYTEGEQDRSFLISESVRGEGAKLYDKHMQRFVDELIPRDLLTEAIRQQMDEDGTAHVWEDMRPIDCEEQQVHFPNIVAYAASQGYDTTKECIPVVPAQHYFMGGIWVDYVSQTSMHRLYAVGETACNGVHGKNRLASNSLLESLVFAKRAASSIAENYQTGYFAQDDPVSVAKCLREIDLAAYLDDDAITTSYRKLVQDAITAAGGKPSDFKQESDYRKIQNKKGQQEEEKYV